MAARVQPTTYAVTQKEPCGGHPQACTEDMIQVRRGCMVAWFLHSWQLEWKLRPLQVHTKRVLEILAQQQWRCNEGTVELAAALHNNSILCTSWFSVSLLDSGSSDNQPMTNTSMQELVFRVSEVCPDPVECPNPQFQLKSKVVPLCRHIQNLLHHLTKVI